MKPESVYTHTRSHTHIHIHVKSKEVNEETAKRAVFVTVTAIKTFTDNSWQKSNPLFNKIQVKKSKLCSCAHPWLFVLHSKKRSAEVKIKYTDELLA